MGPSGSCFEFIHHDDMINDGWIDSRFTLVPTCILIITYGCIEDNEQVIWIVLID